MLGLVLRNEFRGRRLKGTRIELPEATRMAARDFLRINYPSGDVLRAIEAIGPGQARPVALIGERGLWKSHQGVIDLVEDAVQVVDFKTGKQKDAHELELQMYAVLCWRRTGVRPSRLAVQHLTQRREFEVREADLLAADAHLESSIADARRLLADTPAEARPGKECDYRAARAPCGAEWRAYQASLGRPTEGTTKVEVVVAAQPSLSGFLTEVGGREVDVVIDATVAQHLPEVGPGVSLRLLDVVGRDERKTFEIRPWTEVYGVRQER